MLNSKEDIAAYFYEQVLTQYYEFIKCRNSPEIGGGRDLRAALNAAEAIYHFREQLTDAFRPRYEHITAECPDYALTRDVANLKKHSRRSRESQLRDADAIQEIVLTTIFEDTLGEYYNSVKEFELHLVNGTTRELSEVMMNSINFWCRHLAAQHVTPKFPEFTMPNAVKPLPRVKCQSIANITITKGLKFGPAVFQLQRYNYSTGQVHPVNLTGYKPISMVFKPKHEVDLVLQNKSTGEKLTRTIALNPDQSKEFDALKSNEERQNYLSKIPQVMAAFASLASEAAASGKINKSTDKRHSNP
jgi:hypothetical protein